MPGPHAWLEEPAGRGSREGPGRGSNLSSGRSCSTSHRGASSSSTFSTSRGKKAPAAPHAAEGFGRDSARLWVGPSDARPSPHFKALLTTSPPASPPDLRQRRSLAGFSTRMRAAAGHETPRTLSMRVRAARSRPRGGRRRRRVPLVSRRPSPTRRKLRRTALKTHNLPSRHAASGTEGLHPLEYALGVGCTALPRHGIVRMPADASASSAQSSGITTTQSAP